MRHGIVLACASMALCVPLTGCTTNEATGKRIFTLGMSREQEIQIGMQAAPEFTAEFGGAVPVPELQSYVGEIGRKMAAETEGDNPTLPWEFTLLNTDVVNAFALPGGKVFFTRGLAEDLTSEAQMAGVIGHEIGHVTARHGAQRIASQTALGGLLEVSAAVVGASGSQAAQAIGQVGIPALKVGGSLVLLKYGREEELEADSLGMRYMSNVGYNPRGQLEVMQVLAKLSGGGGRGPEFLSTHPFPENRIERIQNELRTTYAAMADNPNYGTFEERYQRQCLARLKQLPPAPAPRQQGKLGGSDGTRVALDLENPASWCGLCAAGTSARGMLAASAVLRAGP